MTFNELSPIVRDHLRNFDNVFTVEVNAPFQDAIMNGNYLISCACDDRHISYDTNDFLWYSLSHMEFEQEGNFLTFYVTYYSTKEQQEQAVTAVEGLAASLNISSLGRAEAVRAFYNWIADNVIYDTSVKQILQYTPIGESFTDVARNSLYDVIVEKKAVCQGISVAMFYFINRYITPCRIIQGNELSSAYRLFYHCWNIIKLNDDWYYTDATAAAERHATDPATQESWLLKNAYDFTHIANAAKYVPLPGYMRNEWIKQFSNIAANSWQF